MNRVGNVVGGICMGYSIWLIHLYGDLYSLVLGLLVGLFWGHVLTADKAKEPSP